MILWKQGNQARILSQAHKKTYRCTCTAIEKLNTFLKIAALLSRTYFNTRFQLVRHFDLCFKYALSWYPDRETSSSGLNEIQEHHRQDHCSNEIEVINQ